MLDWTSAEKGGKEEKGSRRRWAAISHGYIVHETRVVTLASGIVAPRLSPCIFNVRSIVSLPRVACTAKARVWVFLVLL